MVRKEAKCDTNAGTRTKMLEHFTKLPLSRNKQQEIMNILQWVHLKGSNTLLPNSSQPYHWYVLGIGA